MDLENERQKGVDRLLHGISFEDASGARIAPARVSAVAPLERREATETCRCRGCGGDEPMGCGSLCADCSWEDHLAGMAHTGASWDQGETHAGTPACCRASREEERAYFAAEAERS